MKETVNHPSHYNKPGQDEAIVVMVKELGMRAVIGFCDCNVIKYRYRADLKGTKNEDLRKADWYENASHELYSIMLEAQLNCDDVEDIIEFCIEEVEKWSEKNRC